MPNCATYNGATVCTPNSPPSGPGHPAAPYLPLGSPASHVCTPCSCTVVPDPGSQTPCAGGTPWIDLGVVGFFSWGRPIFGAIAGTCPALTAEPQDPPE